MPKAANELARLEALRSYQILDTPEESDFDDLTKLASVICNTPVALISLIDQDRQWFKSHVGTAATQTPITESFCVHAIKNADEMMIVDDATTDERFRDNPLVTGDPNIIFYAGVPLVNEDGYALGTLCVIDNRQNHLSDQQSAALKVIAKQVVDKMELKRKIALLEHANNELHQSETRLTNLVEQAPVAIAVIKGPNLIIESANPQMLHFWRKDESVIGMPLALALPHLIGQPHIDRLSDIFRSGEPYFGYERKVSVLINDKIEDRFLNFAYQPLKNNYGATDAVMTIATDVTEQVTSRKVVTEINQRLNIALDAGAFGSTEVDLATGKMDCNAQFKKCYGRSEDEDFTYTALINAILPQYRGHIQNLVTIAKENHTIYEAEYEVAWPDGSIHWINAHGRARYDEHGIADRLVGVVSDITAQVAGKQAIIESEERFRSMAETSGILIAVGDETSNATYFSKAWVEITGRSMEDLLAFGWVDLVHSEDRDRYVNIYLDAFKIRAPFIGEFRILSKAGDYRWILAKGQPRFHKDGAFAGYIAACTDITDQLNIRQQLKDSEERLQLLADNISQLAWMTDDAGYIFWYNKRWYDYTGTTFEEMQGWGWNKVHHPDHIKRVIEKWTKNIESGEIWEDTFPLLGKDGEYRWFLSRAVPLKDETGKVIRWFGSNTDVTEQRQDEQRKNDFIAMVSHELKTPLTSLMGYVQLLQYITHNHEDKKLSDVLEKSKNQVKKMNTMITGFLDMSRFESGKIHLDKQPFLLNDLITEAIADATLVTSTHELIFEACAELALNADRDKIAQVITNLISNAIKYSPNGKRIVVTCSKNEGMALVSVSDEGMGIHEQDLEKLFNRFYRVESKYTETISGFGIGLYLSAEIIKRHNGKIWVNSTVGKGSVFYFSIPI